MLFRAKTDLLPCAIFVGLHALLREVILAGCGDRRVDDAQMPNMLWDAVCGNAGTLKVIDALRAKLDLLAGNEKHALWLNVRAAPSVRELMCEPTAIIPTPPESIVSELKKCVEHLFDRTAKLVTVERACGESLAGYFNRYSADWPHGNGIICGICGTEVLAQRRLDVESEDQWRAPFDHLLAETQYPLIALDPMNLLPVCHTCNSKAKLAKDILYDDQGRRRRSFDPWSEYAADQLAMSVKFDSLIPLVDVEFQPRDLLNEEKLLTWDNVYKIRQRVKGEFRSLSVKLIEDLNLDTLVDFKNSIQRQANIRIGLCRVSPFNHWRGTLYRGMQAIPDAQLDRLRETCRTISIQYFEDAGIVFDDLLNNEAGAL